MERAREPDPQDRPAAQVEGSPTDERPLYAVARSWTGGLTLVAALVIGIVVVRILAVIGLRPYIYVDSGEYAVVDFTGRGRRPWATPYLHWLIPGDHRWEIVGQALVGGLCWAVLGLAVAAWFRERRVRLVATGAVVALGLTTSITNWDAAILSESLALSLTALLVAAWLNLARRPSVMTAALVVAATFPWLFVRQSLLPTAWLVVAAAIAATLVTWRRAGAWRPLAGLAVGLVLLTGLASASYSRNQEVVRANLTTIVANRIATDPDRLSWFRENGMPVPASGALDPGALTIDPAYGRWVGGEGRTTYARYLLTHPWYTLTEPLGDLVSVRQSYGDEPVEQSTMLSPGDGYGSARPVIPEVVEQILFEPGGTGTVLTAMVAVVGLSLVRRRRRDRRWAVPLALVAISVVSLIVAWHGATPELGRLAIVAAVALRLGLILQLGFLAEDHLLDRPAYPRTP